LVGNKKTEYIDGDVELLEAIANCVGPILHARLDSEVEEKERKRAEEKLRASYRFLEIANRYSEMTPLLNAFV
jgi:tellurite resistance protein